MSVDFLGSCLSSSSRSPWESFSGRAQIATPERRPVPFLREALSRRGAKKPHPSWGAVSRLVVSLPVLTPGGVIPYRSILIWFSSISRAFQLSQMPHPEGPPIPRNIITTAGNRAASPYIRKGPPLIRLSALPPAVKTPFRQDQPVTPLG